MQRTLLIVALLVLGSTSAVAQCCSGGGGGSSSLAGDFAAGVLAEKQWSFNLNYQRVHSERFFAGKKEMAPSDYHSLAPNNYLAGFDNNYLYARLGYGLTEKLTISLESGYYINKTEYRENYLVDSINSKGLSDLIIFPRYTAYFKKTSWYQAELTVGLGFKIPIGSHNDSVVVFSDPASGLEFKDMKSPSVQLSSGANDVMFSAMYSRNFKPKKFIAALQGFYVHRGWNSTGEKFGDYMSISLMGSKKLFPNLVAVSRFKGERITEKEQRSGMAAFLSASDLAENSGGDKLHFVPQLIYTVPSGLLNASIMLYAFTELPLYQEVNGIQLGSQLNFSIGFDIRFNPPNKQEVDPIAPATSTEE